MWGKHICHGCSGIEDGQVLSRVVIQVSNLDIHANPLTITCQNACFSSSRSATLVTGKLAQYACGCNHCNLRTGIQFVAHIPS